MLFALTPQTGVETGTIITSNIATITGIDSTSMISIVGGSYTINGGTALNTASMVFKGARVAVQVLSNAQFGSTASVILTIGGVTASFVVTARAQDFIPDAFRFTPQTGVETGTIITSNIATITGIDSTSMISIVGGSYTINGGTALNTASMVFKGARVAVQVLSNAQFGSTASVILTIGGVTASFVVTARAQDFIPDAFRFTPQTGVETGTIITSNIATITGIDSTSMISIVAGSYTINGQQTTAATISNNSTVTVLLLSSRHFTTPASAILTVGEVTASFSVTTRAQDFTPERFENFASVATDTADATVTSNIQTITGLDINASISIEGGEYQINDNAFTAASGTIYNGQQVAVRLMSGEQQETKRVTLTIGTISKFFEVSTDAADTSPTIFRFDATRNVELNATITSNQITVSGINQATVIFIENGWYQINGNPVTNVRDLVNANERVRVLHRSANSYNTTTVSTLTIDSVVATFISTTRAQDFTPDTFNFMPQTNVEIGTLIISNVVNVTGIDTTTTISIIGGSYTINGGTALDTASMVFKGDQVAVQVLSSMQFSTTASAILDIGGVTASFIVTTRATDTQPHQFAFTPVINATPNAVISSMPTKIIGFDHATISIIGGSYTINGGTTLNSATTIFGGDSVVVELLSSMQFSSVASAMVTIGGVTANFVVTTRATDTQPHQFAFTPVINATPNAVISSEPVEIIGFDHATISIIGGSYTINGGTALNSATTIFGGDSVVVELLSSMQFNSAASAMVTIGGVTASFVVITGVSLDVDGDLDADANDGVLIHRVLSGQDQVTRAIAMPIPKGAVTKTYTAAQVQVIVTSASPNYNIDSSAQTTATDGLLIRRYLSNAGNITANTGIDATTETVIIDKINSLMPKYGN